VRRLAGEGLKRKRYCTHNLPPERIPRRQTLPNHDTYRDRRYAITPDAIPLPSVIRYFGVAILVSSARLER